MAGENITADDFNWFHSGQAGAPQMNGAPNSEGQLLQLLDACLLNGVNQKSVASIAVVGSTITLTYSTPHGYLKRQRITVSGATDPELNGSHRIQSMTESDVILSVEGVSSNGGTITTIATPLGWESIFGTTEPLKRAYRSQDMQSTKTVLFLDMTLPNNHGYNASNPVKRAMVTACQDMTTLGVPIDDYTVTINNRPTATNGSLFWYQKRGSSKSSAVTTTTNNSWVLLGDSRFFIFFNAFSDFSTLNGSSSHSTYGFGDFDSVAGENDRHNCFLIATENPDDRVNVNSSNGGYVSSYKKTTYTALSQEYYDDACIAIRSANGTGDARRFVLSTTAASQANTNGLSASGLAGIPYPNPVDGGVVVKYMEMISIDNNELRGFIPRIGYICNNMSGQASQHLTVNNNYLIIQVQRQNATSVMESFFAFYIGD